MHRLNRSLLALILAAGLCITGCGNPAYVPTATAPNPSTSLQKVAAAEVAIGQAVGALQSTVIAANSKGLLSDDTTRTILQLSLKISQADAQAIALTQGIVALGPGQMTSLAALFAPIAQAVNDTLASGLVPIKDQATLTAVKTALTTVQALITGLQLVIGG